MAVIIKQRELSRPDLLTCKNNSIEVLVNNFRRARSRARIKNRHHYDVASENFLAENFWMNDVYDMDTIAKI